MRGCPPNRDGGGRSLICAVVPKKDHGGGGGGESVPREGVGARALPPLAIAVEVGLAGVGWGRG